MANAEPPNILLIMSDDIGWFNVSCYNHGVMGYRKPNIDRIAAEGAMFTGILLAAPPGAPGGNGDPTFTINGGDAGGARDDAQI